MIVSCGAGMTVSRGVRRLLLAVAALFALSAAARAADPDALWHIVHERCAPGAAARGNPAPCALVAYPLGEASGYAVLKDRDGDSQFLLIPTAKITGIEDPAILASDATDYWAAAWSARRFTLARLGRALPRDALSLAINSPSGRSQNQLHIHVDCVRADVRAALHAQLDAIGRQWSPLDGALAGHPYRARRLDGAELGDNPFRLLADSPEVGVGGIGRHTLVVVGATFAAGRDGFVLLDDSVDASPLDRASGEELQDHDCALARLLPN
jgi:CDP-diacylglycerol pyrophosphatase